MVKTGVRGPYTWFQSTSHYLSVLVDRVSDIVVGKYVAVSAYEGAPLKLTGDEMQLGWQQHSKLSLSPIIQRPSEIPQNQLDEWYTFVDLKPLSISEIFINYGGFSLAQSASDNPFLPDSVKQKNTKENSILNQRQKRFWAQIESCKPESFLAESDKLIVVSRDPTVVAELKEFFSQSSFQLPNNASLRNKISVQQNSLSKKL